MAALSDVRTVAAATGRPLTERAPCCGWEGGGPTAVRAGTPRSFKPPGASHNVSYVRDWPVGFGNRDSGGKATGQFLLGGGRPNELA